MSVASDEPVDPFAQALADRLRAAKQEKHYSVRSLAAATGLSESSIQRYLDGRRAVPIPALRTIAGVLGTTAGTLLDEAEAVADA